MRWAGQLAVVAVLGVTGYAGWYAYRGGYLAQVPGLSAYAPAAPGGAPQQAPQTPPPVVDVDTVRTAAIVETREAVGTVRALESIVVTAKAPGPVTATSLGEGRRPRAAREP